MIEGEIQDPKLENYLLDLPKLLGRVGVAGMVCGEEQLRRGRRKKRPSTSSSTASVRGTRSD